MGICPILGGPSVKKEPEFFGVVFAPVKKVELVWHSVTIKGGYYAPKYYIRQIIVFSIFPTGHPSLSWRSVRLHGCGWERMGQNCPVLDLSITLGADSSIDRAIEEAATE